MCVGLILFLHTCCRHVSAIKHDNTSHDENRTMLFTCLLAVASVFIAVVKLLKAEGNLKTMFFLNVGIRRVFSFSPAAAGSSCWARCFQCLTLDTLTSFQWLPWKFPQFHLSNPAHTNIEAPLFNVWPSAAFKNRYRDHHICPKPPPQTVTIKQDSW